MVVPGRRKSGHHHAGVLVAYTQQFTGTFEEAAAAATHFMGGCCGCGVMAGVPCPCRCSRNYMLVPASAVVEITNWTDCFGTDGVDLCVDFPWLTSYPALDSGSWSCCDGADAGTYTFDLVHNLVWTGTGEAAVCGDYSSDGYGWGRPDGWDTVDGSYTIPAPGFGFVKTPWTACGGTNVAGADSWTAEKSDVLGYEFRTGLVFSKYVCLIQTSALRITRWTPNPGNGDMTTYYTYRAGGFGAFNAGTFPQCHDCTAFAFTTDATQAGIGCNVLLSVDCASNLMYGTSVANGVSVIMQFTRVPRP